MQMKAVSQTGYDVDHQGNSIGAHLLINRLINQAIILGLLDPRLIAQMHLEISEKKYSEKEAPGDCPWSTPLFEFDVMYFAPLPPADDQYWVFREADVLPGYPQPIREYGQGVPAHGIDTAVWWEPNGYTYFFSDDRYLTHSLV